MSVRGTGNVRKTAAKLEGTESTKEQSAQEQGVEIKAQAIEKTKSEEAIEKGEFAKRQIYHVSEDLPVYLL